MRAPARAVLAAAALALAGAAAAQAPTIVSGGVRFTLEPAFTVEVSLEHPLVLTGDGWRVGLVTSLRAHAAPTGGWAAALAGVAATLPAAGGAVQAQLLYHVEWASPGSVWHGPELVIAFQTTIR